MHPIVDTHQHLWDLTKFNLPWLNGIDKLDRSFVMDDYFDATDGLPIEKTVYMEVDVAADQKQAEAEYVTKLCEADDNPMQGAVIGGLIANEGFEAYVSEYKGHPRIKGVRQVMHNGPAGACLEEDFIAGVRLLGQLGMSFDLCLRPTELADGVKLADLCESTLIILDHCGNAKVTAFAADADDDAKAEADQWRRDIASLADRDHVVCKISGIIAGAPEGWTYESLAPIVNHCLDSFGPDRVFFGGDWPVCTLGAPLRDWAKALARIVEHRPKDEQKKLFHANASRIYGLD